jgi:integrase
VLYLDKDLVEKTRELGFNLSKTCENHLRNLIATWSNQHNSIWWAGPDLNQRPLARKAPEMPSENESQLLERFHDFQIVDLRRSKRTAYEKVWFIKRFLKTVGKKSTEINTEDLRGYLKNLQGYSQAFYKNALMSLKVFYRDFLGLPELVASFKFPHRVFKPKQIVNKEQLNQFYENLETVKEKALFMLYATTGLRRQEILSLKLEDIDFSKRMITPNIHEGETKKSWVSFFNDEAEAVLNEYLATKKPSKSQRLFPMQRKEAINLWEVTKEKTGFNITPQRLREWFCSEMVSKGVSDSYVDAFCGRTPKSILARHYMDYAPSKLEKIYENARLKVID